MKDQVIQDYVASNHPKLYILTPCYGGVCYANYVISLMNTINLLKQLNIKYQVEYCCNDSLVPRARNNLIARAFSDPDMTHIIFIDADISWDPNDIIKLLVSDKHLIGGIYPLKRYNWNKIVQDPSLVHSWVQTQQQNEMYKNYSAEHFIQSKLVDYNVVLESTSLTIENNLSEVKYIPTGFMMMQRKTIELMQKAFPSTKYVDDVSYLSEQQNNHAYALFDCGVEDNHYLSEDWLFCSRWKKMGGKIFMDVTVNLTHTGTENFRGSYLASILA